MTSTQKRRPSSLPSLWLAKTKDKDKLKEHILREVNNPTLQRLLEIVEEKLDEANRRETNSSVYDNPSWAYYQAHNNGVRHGLQQIADLLQFMKGIEQK